MQVTVTTKTGKTFKVDCSSEAICGLLKKEGVDFKLKNGDPVFHQYAGKGVVVGVAPATSNEGCPSPPDVLWCKFDNFRDSDSKGRVTYSYPLDDIIPLSSD